MNNPYSIISEIIFNISYITILWYLVIQMSRKMETVQPKNIKTAKLILLAFTLLAIGDTGHVGFRVIAYALGGLQTTISFIGINMSLVGLGMLITAYTVTFFYMIFIFIWQERFQKPQNWFTHLLLAMGLIRIILMALPGNNWSIPSVQNQIGFYRNLPLMIQGFGLIALFLISAKEKEDKLFRNIAYMIILSFAFYIPVILFASKIPLLGLLMIPKTCAYLAIAIIAYKQLWPRQSK